MFSSIVPRLSQVSCSCVVYGYDAAVYIVKTHQQVDDGGFAAAGGANQRHALAWLHPQVEVFDKGLGLLVGKIYMLGGHGALGLAQLPGAGGVWGLGGFFYEREDPTGAGQGVLQFCHHAGNFVKGLGVLVGVA